MSQPLITPEAVDSIFSNFKECLPVWVSAKPSIRKGLFTTVIIIIIFITIALNVKKSMADKPNIFSKTIWIAIIIVGIYLGGMIGDHVKDRDYMLRSFKLNSQHYANIHWLGLYVKSLKSV